MDPYVVSFHLGLGIGVIKPAFYISLVIWDGTLFTSVGARVGMWQFVIRANPWPEVCRRGPRAPKGGGLLNPTSLRGVDLVILICIFSSLPSTRPFGSSLASGSVGTPKLSEFTREQSHDGWPAGKFSYEFPETKPWGRGRGPHRTISCYGGVVPGMWWGPGRGCDINNTYR